MKQGYGEKYANLVINNSIITKKSKNEEGNKKIQREINFYNFILKNDIEFKIPDIFSNKNNEIRMKYYKNHITLQKYLENNQKSNIIEIVLEKIKTLHFQNISISYENYKKLLLEETIYKIKKRRKEIMKLVSDYNYINKVNGIKILTFDYIINNLEKKLIEEINKMKNFCLNPIHGDLHLNNILINNDDLIFIDPKGYFGSSEIYGIKEYDYAKFYFGLEGYSYFDFMDINKLDIERDNILIEIPKFNFNTKYSNFTKLLIISIWLGNAHSFENDLKKITSYFYSLFLSTKYL